MTVTFLEEIPQPRSGKNTRGARTYTRAFKFKTSLQSEGPYAVGSHSSVPKIGAPHNEDPNAYCYDIDVQCTDGWTGWTVTCLYTDEITLNENPLAEPAVIEWDKDPFQEVTIKDRSGYALLNSAGDFIPDIFRERSRRVVSVVKNVSSVPTWILDAEDAVNSSAFLLDGVSIATGLARLPAPRIGRWQKRNGWSFREMSMTFLLNKDGWAATPLDRGFRFKNGSGDRIRITNDDGTDVTEPVCLDGTGLVLSNPTPSTAVYLSFNIYPAYDFNLLPLT